MSLVKNQKFNITIIFALILGLMTFPINPALANSSEEVPTEEEVQEKVATILSAFSYENETVEFDESIATSNGLTDTEVAQLKEFFSNADHEFLIDLQNAKNGVAESDGMVTPQAVPLLPAAVVAFLGTLAVFVGWELAKEITADFYNYGVTKACQTWDHVDVVADFCVINDYL